MKNTKREIWCYNRMLVTFASNTLFILLLVIGVKQQIFILALIGNLGVMAASLYIFYIGHCLGWEQKRIDIMGK